MPSPGAGQSHELHVQAVEIIGPSDAKASLSLTQSTRQLNILTSQTFPIQKKYQSPEYLRTLPHLRSRLPFYSTLLRLRSDVVSSVNGFFASRDFIQTHPPIITSSDCEGAGEVFTVTPASIEALSSLSSSSPSSPPPSFFRAPKYLTVSTQLHLEALAQSVGSVWTLSPTFRAEESDTPRHLSEFYMLEAEACFVDRLDGIMDLAEDLLRAVTANLQSSRVAAELLERPSTKKGGGSLSRADSSSPLPPPEDVARRWQGLVHSDRWPRITYSEAIRMLAAAPVEFEYAPVWGTDLHTEHEKYLAQAVGGSSHTPVFVTHYPRKMKAFYMLPSEHPDDSAAGDTVDCFDLLVPEFCEIAGGSMREHRLPQLVAAMQARGMDVSAEPASLDGDLQQAKVGNDLDWYVDLRRWGCPPHGGFGIGFDRLLCYLSGVQTIRDTVAFPRWFGRCDC